MLSRVDKVRLLQSLLLALGYSISVDGDYGSGTAAALEDFKQKHDIAKEDNLSNTVFESLANAVKVLFIEPDLPNNRVYDKDDKFYDLVIANIFPQADKAFLRAVFEEIGTHLDMFEMNTPLRQAHSLAQTRSECGASLRIRENLNYTPRALKSIFSYYRLNPEVAEQHGRTDDHPADQEAIANHAYAGRIGNGDIASGDGWRYRGRGIKQLTGKSNYAAFTQWYAKHFPEEIDFVKEPDLLFEPKYAAASGAYFWVKHRLYLIADQGPTAQTVNAITLVINRKLPRAHRDKRVKYFNDVWKIVSA